MATSTRKPLPETPDGWLLGVECGYKHHAGFVKDGVGGKMLWSLTPAESGWVLTLIDNRVAVSTRRFETLDEAVRYVG